MNKDILQERRLTFFCLPNCGNEGDTSEEKTWNAAVGQHAVSHKTRYYESYFYQTIYSFK